MPMYAYNLEDDLKKEDFDHSPSQKTVESFITKIFHKMKLTNEVCLLSLIFIERLIVRSDS